MITGKHASIHITKSAIRVVEAVVSRGRVEVTNALTIPNAARFFNNRGKLINMVTLVDTMVMSMESAGMTAKKLFVSFEGAFQTTFSIEPLSTVPEKRKGFSFKKGKPDNDKLDLEDNAGATIRRQHNWGQYVTQDDQGEAVSITAGERDMVDSMVETFSSHGYSVVSLEAPDTVLVYTRNTEAFSYDSLNKIIVYADNDETGELYIMTKDVPSSLKRIQFDSYEGVTFQDHVREVCLQEMNVGQMRNPNVYLVGEAFSNVDDYIMIAQDLEYEGMQVVDLYAINKSSDATLANVQICIADEAVPTMEELNGSYGICICQLLRCFDPKPVNMCENRLNLHIPAQYTIMASKVIMGLAIAFLAINVILTGLTSFEAISVQGALQDSDALRSQLTRVETQRDEAQLQLSALETIDNRLAAVFNFIYANVDSSLNIASVDSVDMIPVDSSSSSEYSETEDANTEKQTQNTEQPGATESTKKQLVIRGYSTKSSGSVELYNALTRYGFTGVKLEGHQQVNLPSGETIYVFEIRIGEGGFAS